MKSALLTLLLAIPALLLFVLAGEERPAENRPLLPADPATAARLSQHYSRGNNRLAGLVLLVVLAGLLWFGY